MSLKSASSYIQIQARKGGKDSMMEDLRGMKTKPKEDKYALLDELFNEFLK